MNAPDRVIATNYFLQAANALQTFVRAFVRQPWQAPDGRVYLATRCERSDLPTYSCAHCRADVQARLKADPVYAAWLAGEARMPWEIG